jgi:hypothetical protein
MRESDWSSDVCSSDLLEARLFGPAGSYPAVPLWAEARVAAVAPTLHGVGEYGPAWWGEWQF